MSNKNRIETMDIETLQDLCKALMVLVKECTEAISRFSNMFDDYKVVSVEDINKKA